MRKRHAAANGGATFTTKTMDLAREIDKLLQQSLGNDIQTLENSKQALTTPIMNHETAMMNCETA